LVAVVVCAIVGVLLLAPPALAAGTWSATGSLNTAREFHTATLLPDGKVLVAGGNASNGLLASAELFSLLSPADLAAQLVADSTGKGPGKALANKATAIQTAVNAGQTATACAGITDYLGLVNAQTGKKLTPEQADQLTTDATHLADALGC
jgi:hypothetical protein